MKLKNPSVASDTFFGKSLMSLQHTIMAIDTRARDPKPEEVHPIAPQTAKSPALAWGWLPILSFTSALGTLSVAYADTAARYVTIDVSIFLWLGLLLVFVPSIVRLLSPTASRFERIGILCVIGICFYFQKVMYNPISFTSYDEFLQWRTATDLAGSSHLFGENPLFVVGPDYPGLQIVTNALSTLSGLTIFQGGMIVVGVARLVMILSMFLLNEQILKSARMAGIATGLYMTNPHFVFFDAAFSYESLALPLATFMLFAMAYQETLNNERYLVMLIAWIALGAVVVTHHVTDFIFDGWLLLWMVMLTLLRHTHLHKSHVAQTALFGILISVAYVMLIATPVVEYLSSFFGATLTELEHVLVGSSSARQLFVDYGGGTTPLWERIASFSSVALIGLSLPFGLFCLWRRYRSNTLVYMFGVVSLFYPVSQIFRFTSSGSELSDRTAAFLFIPISCVLAIFITQFWPTRWLSRKQTTLIACALSLVFLGGTVLGAGTPWSLLPGPYLVAADQRSIEPEGVQAAQWARLYLGPNNRIATDRVNQLLMGTYGDESVVTNLVDNVDVTPIFFSSSLGPNELAILRRARVRYLVIDLRLAYALPQVGFYFEPYEPDAFHHIAPIDLEALTKFSTIPQVNRVFDSGDIVIYDVGGLINAP